MSEKEKLSPEKKVEVVRRCLKDGISINAASREAAVSRTTVWRWIAQYETEGIDSFFPVEEKSCI